MLPLTSVETNVLYIYKGNSQNSLPWGRQGKNLNNTVGNPGSKIGGRCKQRAIIFHGRRVIVNFLSKFVAMVTGVGRGET